MSYQLGLSYKINSVTVKENMMHKFLSRVLMLYLEVSNNRKRIFISSCTTLCATRAIVSSVSAQ